LGTEGNTPKDLLSVDEAVEAYGLSRSTIFRLFKSGLTKYRRRGDRKTYVSRAALELAIAFKADIDG